VTYFCVSHPSNPKAALRTAGGVTLTSVESSGMYCVLLPATMKLLLLLASALFFDNLSLI